MRPKGRCRYDEPDAQGGQALIKHWQGAPDREDWQARELIKEHDEEQEEEVLTLTAS
jgi:hypothetical protein